MPWDPHDSTPDEAPQWPDRATRDLAAAFAKGATSSVPLAGGDAVLDGRTVADPADLQRLVEDLGRPLTADEAAVAPAMLAGPMAWAEDPARHREFVGAELQAWAAARAGGSGSNPYGPEHPDDRLRQVWAVAFTRGQAAVARARRAAAATPIARTVRFWTVPTGATIGLVTLTPSGELEYSNDAVRNILYGSVSRSGPERAFERYTNWSNGYVGSSEV